MLEEGNRDVMKICFGLARVGLSGSLGLWKADLLEFPGIGYVTTEQARRFTIAVAHFDIKTRRLTSTLLASGIINERSVDKKWKQHDPIFTMT